jgi:hypothetical protein
MPGVKFSAHFVLFVSSLLFRPTAKSLGREEAGRKYGADTR